MSHPRILIVDDEEDIRLNLEATLMAEGYETFLAATGAEALVAVARWKPDLALLDIMMPDMDGYEVCRRIKSDPATRTTAVVFASALHKPADKVEGLDLGADDYITKPYDISVMLAKLRALVRVQLYQRRLERLVAFSHGLNTLDLPNLAGSIKKHIAAILPFVLFSIFIRNKETGRLRLFAHNHVGDEAVDDLDPNDSPLMRQALATGERVVVRDFPASPYATGDEREKYTDPFALCQPLKVGGEVVGALNLACNAEAPVTATDLDVVTLAGEMIAAAVANAESHAEQRRLATTDGLTRIANHRHFQERLADEMHRGARSGHPVTMILIDIDHFKKINDTHGHQAGDAALTGLAVCLKKQIRVIDTVARYGGEEFAVILPETDVAAAQAVAERIRTEAMKDTYPSERGGFALTLSLGVCDSSHPAVKKPADLIRLADSALYEAKASGRNRTVLCDVAETQS